VLALCLPITARGAKRQLTPPPMGEDIPVKVMRGGSIDIQLRAHEGRGNPLAYEIVREPQSGRLEDFRQADRNRQGSASIVYVHGDDEESIEDEFAFRARGLIGGGLSSPIKVKLRIVDVPPRLGIAPVVDFSAVAGESDVQQLILANEGGGLLEGSIEPAEPFHIEGDGRFSLGRGQSTGLLIRFSPQSTDSIPPQKLSPAPADPGTSVTLKGEAKAPFSASAEPMELGADGSRTGKFSVANLSTSPLALRFEREPKDTANVPETVQVPAGGMSEIPVTIGTEKKGGAVNLRIRITSTHYEQELVVEAPAVPPKLEVVTPELDFLQTDEAEVLVRNDGGVEGDFSLHLPKGIQSLAGAESFHVPPDSETRVLLRLENKKDAKAGDSLIVDLGKGGKVPVPLLFPYPTPSPTPATTPQPQNTPAEEPPKPWKLNEDVKLETSKGKTFITWSRSKDLWANALLETVTAEGSTPYEGAPEDPRWWQAMKAWLSGSTHEAKEAWQEKQQFFGDRLTVPGEKEHEAGSTGTSESPWRLEAISDRDARGADWCWRITAGKESNGTQEQVSPDFKIDWQTRKLVPAHAESVVPAENSPQPGQTRADEPVLSAKLPFPPSPARAERKIETAAVVPERTRATVKLAIEEDPTITGFRLERGEMVANIDPKTEIPMKPEFVPVKHFGNVAIRAIAATEQEGKKLTVVVATIDGLRPGTATFWRLVPLAGEKESTPTAGFLVPTAPPWQFPWRGFFLALLVALLAIVIWLRHRQRTADRR